MHDITRIEPIYRKRSEWPRGPEKFAFGTCHFCVFPLRQSSHDYLLPVLKPGASISFQLPSCADYSMLVPDIDIAGKVHAHSWSY